MDVKWKAVLAFLVLILFLTGGSLLANWSLFSRQDRYVSEMAMHQPESGESTSLGMSEQDYKRIRMAFNSFDLAAGLTRNDFDSLPRLTSPSLTTLWLCVGAIFFLNKPQKKERD